MRRRLWPIPLLAARRVVPAVAGVVAAGRRPWQPDSPLPRLRLKPPVR
jgi:hypothetical protein